MSYAEVAVGARAAPGKTFSYSIPEGMRVQPGHAVQVPFGTRQIPGFVFQVTEAPSYTETRDISRVIDSGPWLSPAQVELAVWLSHTYQSSLYAAASLMVPPGFRQRVVPVYRATDQPPQATFATLDAGQREVYDHILHHGPVGQGEMDRRFGRRPSEVILGQLVRRRLVAKGWEWLEPRVRAKLVDYAFCVGDRQAALAEAQRLAGTRSKRQGLILQALVDADGAGAPVSSLSERFGPCRPALRALEARGLVAVREERVGRDPLAGRRFETSTPPDLTPDQDRAWREISAALDRGPGHKRQVLLVHGVTGSGKTELYLLALERVVAQGKKGIVLVPEISLTPQTIQRFSGRFPGRVAVLHSRLTPGQQFDEWWRIRQGDFDVVIGSRGAVFAPQPDLGLIVLDEEHEWTYKQHEMAPLYHAREVALKRAEIQGATVVLGSATPQVESYHKAVSGQYRLLELPRRVPPSSPHLSPLPQGERRPDSGSQLDEDTDLDAAGDRETSPPAPSPLTERGQGVRSGEMPRVQVVDMREELKRGNRSIFSNALHNALLEALKKKQQAILFLNRRGAATFVQCRDCGHVLKCKRCSNVLTYHAEDPQLTCHVCGYRLEPPPRCPECWGPNIRYMGLGTERLEMETSKAFPDAMTLRWDRDVTQSAGSHEDILQKFLNREADILIGTQMIAKGLHLPGVTLVGVVNADIGLHAPDFRAPERVFQVLCQVAGRSGRGATRGRVVVQTYSPGHYAIVAAAGQDYRSFYEQEIKLRMERGLPPFNRLARLVFSHTNAAAAKREADRLYAALKEQLDQWAFPATKLVSPNPAPHERIRGHYRWHILVQGPDPVPLLEKVTVPDGWTVDVDPVNLM